MLKNFIFLFSLVLLVSCSNNTSQTRNPVTGEVKKPGIFSKDAEKGISLSDLLNSQSSESNVNVNGFLWRASLDVLSIAPLISTDALGGTIITDWYTNKNIKNKRIKIMAYIKTSELTKPYFTTKADGTGLGLSIVSKIVNDHNGVIIFSNLEYGAKVEIKFYK